MPTHNLSAFRKPEPGEKGIALKPATTAGSWYPLGGSLKELADALAVPDGLEVDEVRSTPDPWAQVRAFADALLTPDRLQGQTVAQWRGLMALLALQDSWAGVYRLQFETVPLAPEGSRLARVLTQLLPTRRLPLAPDPAAGWQNPVVVRLVQPRAGRSDGVGEPIAMLNPASLIAPGRDVARRAYPTIPWMANGLCDPTALTGADALTVEDMAILHAWLGQVERDLEQLCAGAGDDPQLRAMRARLQEFRADCLDPARQPGVADHPQTITPGEPEGRELAEIYRRLRRPMRVAEPEGGTSDCIVPLRGDLGTGAPFRGLLLFDPAIAETLGRSANRVIFWGRTTLKKALEGGPALQADLRRRIADAGYLMVEPQDFFTDMMVRLNLDRREGLIRAHSEAFRDSLLPLTPLALLLFPTGRLAAACSRDSDGQVALKLPLRGAAAGHHVRRGFAARAGPNGGRLIEGVDWALGDVALWPDFQSPKWQRYFARVTWLVENPERLRGRFAGSGRMLADMLNDLAHDRRAADFQPWLSRAPFESNADPLPILADRALVQPWLQRFRGNESSNVAEVQSAPSPFEAIFFSVIPSAGAAPVPAGLVAVELRAPAFQPNNAGVVAVDFGTTNSVACIDNDQPVELKQRIHHPIWSSAPRFLALAMDQIEKNFQDFLPPANRPLPTPTVILKREIDSVAERALESDAGRDAADQLLFRDMIYFQPLADGADNARNLNLGDWHSLLQRAQFNLKWSALPDDRIAARHYLRQMILMLAAEAVDGGRDPARLTWRFSRPEKMAGQREFEQSIRRSLHEAVPGTPDTALDRLQSEGLAAANYILFMGDGSAFTRRAINVILDIGGGTTDIAIWNNARPTPQLVWSSSLRLAGGDFFTSHIVQNPEILKADRLRLDQWYRVMKPGLADGQPLAPDKQKHVGELLFSGRTLTDAINLEWITIGDTPEAVRLKETAAIYLGGSAWHVGRAIRRLVRDGVLAARDIDSIAVALCGRGAGIFSRLHGSDPLAESEISGLMKLVAVAAGAAQPRHPSVFISPSPKIEVVAGMVKRSLISTDLPGSSPLIFLEQDAERPQVAENPASELDEFLASLGHHAGFHVALSAEQRDALPSKVQNGLLRDLDTGHDPLPEFVGQLRVLVTYMIAPAGDPLRPATRWS